jgi:hypothetical protein
VRRRCRASGVARRARPLGAVGWVVLAALLLAGCADDVLGVTWVRQERLVVVDGARLGGVLLITGGEVLLAPGSRADGPVLLLGGTLTVDGLVAGDVLAPGGGLALGPWAVVRGNLAAGGDFERHPEALVAGEVTIGAGWPAAADARRGGGWWRVALQALMTAAWAAAWARWAPRRLGRMADALRWRHLPVAASLGFLVFVVAVVAAVVMAFTIVLIPASLLLLALGVVVVGTGWAALGLALAGAAARGPLPWLRERPVWSAAIGAFDVALVLGLIERVPLVGGSVALAVSVVALGAVALTGLGARRFEPAFVGEELGD